MRDYKLYLIDILKAIISIEDFTRGMTFETLKNDDKTTSAVVRKLEIIGEASKQVPVDLRNRCFDIPGKKWLVCAIH